MFLLYYIYYALAFRVDGIGLPLGQYLSLPYPEMSSKSNVLVENTEKILLLIEQHFAVKEPVFSQKDAESILNRIIQSFSTPHPLMLKLDSLSRLMQIRDVESSINSMKSFVAELQRNNRAKGSIQTYKQFVEMMSFAAKNFKSIERSVKLEACKALFDAVMLYKQQLANFYDIIKT